jgi:hypothetical protein
MFGSPSADVNNRQRLAVIDFMLCTPRFTLSDLVSRTRLDATVVHSVVNEVQDHLTQVGTRDLAPQRPASIEYRAEASLFWVRWDLDSPRSLALSGIIREAGTTAPLVNYREKLRAAIRRLDAISEQLQRAVTLLTRYRYYPFYRSYEFYCSWGVDGDEVTEVLRKALGLASPSICSRNPEESFPAVSALLEEAVGLAGRCQPELSLYGWRWVYFPPDGLLTLVREASEACKRRARELVNAENNSYTALPLRSVEHAARPDLGAITFLLKDAISQTESSASHCQGWWFCHSAHIAACLRNALRSVETVAGVPRFSFWDWYPGCDWRFETTRGLTSAVEAVEQIVSDHSRSTCSLCAHSVEAAIVRRCNRIVLLIGALLAEHAAAAPERCSQSLDDEACLFDGRVPARSHSMTQRGNILDRPILFLSEIDHFALRDMCEGTLITGAPGSGKTTAVGWRLAYEQLAARNTGGLVTTAKAEETNDWRAYAKACGRETDLIMFNSDSGRYFDPLHYEWVRPGLGAGDLESTIDLFSTLVFIGEKEAGHRHDPFWEHASEQLIRNCIGTLCGATTGLKILSSQTRLTPGSSARRVAREGGATFPDLVYQDWIAQYYKSNPNLKLRYDPFGSEDGIRSFLRGHLDFAGCDWPPTPDDEGTVVLIVSSPLARLYIYIPSVACPGTPILRFSRRVLAGIFKGEIRCWDDPVILRESLGRPPRAHINVVRPNDGSGTTLVLTTFLSVRGKAWRLGTGLRVNWPALTNAAMDNSGGKFLSNPFDRLFGGDKCDFTPEDTTRRNKIIICDFPMLEFRHETGRAINLILKLILQGAWRSRKLSESAKPVFLWQDEFQYFVIQRDNFFQQIPRGSHDAVVCLTQNVVNLSEELRGHQAGSKTKSFLGNLATKVFHQPNEAETCNYAADKIGEQYCYLDNFFARSSSSRGQKLCVDEMGISGISLRMQTGWSRAVNTLDEGLGGPRRIWRNSTLTHRERSRGFFSTSNTNDWYLRIQRNTWGPSPGVQGVGSATLNRSDLRSGYTTFERVEAPCAWLIETDTCALGNVQ